MISLPDRVGLDHGEGGAATNRLIDQIFFRHFGRPKCLEDAAPITGSDRMVMTTDSFVVKPLEFPGGDIGKLAVCGTVNDIAVMGARPAYLTAGFIIEEGLPTALLDRIVASMAATAREAGITIVAGDTKVVGKGDADQLFINTSGIGLLPDGVSLSSAKCRPGDAIIVSGPIAEHGMAIVVAREGFGLSGDLISDCAHLEKLTAVIIERAPNVRCMRDLTRGGLATCLVEVAQSSGVCFDVEEGAIPIRQPVRAACDLLGFDPLYLACEGRLMAIVPDTETASVLDAMKRSPLGAGATRIGTVTEGRGVKLQTLEGGIRPLILFEGVMLPRIC